MTYILSLTYALRYSNNILSALTHTQHMLLPEPNSMCLLRVCVDVLIPRSGDPTRFGGQALACVTTGMPAMLPPLWIPTGQKEEICASVRIVVYFSGCRHHQHLADLKAVTVRK